MTIKEPTETLLLEYGINFIQYSLMALLDETGRVSWPDSRFSAVSGQPGQSLRKLVDRGLLTGPDRKQKIRAVPFALSAPGKIMLDKVQRGLHLVSWLSPLKWAALSRLSEGPLPKDEREGVRQVTLNSLSNNGYVELVDGAFHLTGLGREAWAEAVADNRRMCKLCQSSLRQPLAGEVTAQPCFALATLEHYHPNRREPTTIPVNCRQFSHVNGGSFR